MLTLELKGIRGDTKGKIELPESLFGITPSQHAVYEACKTYLANRRRGTASTKTRSDVRGGGRKPWRQKGTGRARVGSIRSPIWVGGGVAFGPKPRDYGYAVPKKVRRLALKSALSAKAMEEKIHVIEDFSFEEPKTKKMEDVLGALGLKGKETLLLVSSFDQNVFKSGRNLPYLTMRAAKDINCYEVLRCEHLVVLQSAVSQLKEVWGESSKHNTGTSDN